MSSDAATNLIHVDAVFFLRRFDGWRRILSRPDRSVMSGSGLGGVQERSVSFVLPPKLKIAGQAAFALISTKSRARVCSILN